MLGLLKKEGQTSSLETVKMLRQFQKMTLDRKKGIENKKSQRNWDGFRQKEEKEKEFEGQGKKECPQNLQSLPLQTRGLILETTTITFHRKQIQCLYIIPETFLISPLLLAYSPLQILYFWSFSLSILLSNHWQPKEILSNDIYMSNSSQEAWQAEASKYKSNYWQSSHFTVYFLFITRANTLK